MFLLYGAVRKATLTGKIGLEDSKRGSRKAAGMTLSKQWGIAEVSVECSWKNKETKKRRIVKSDGEGCVVEEGKESM